MVEEGQRFPMVARHSVTGLRRDRKERHGASLLYGKLNVSISSRPPVGTLQSCSCRAKLRWSNKGVHTCEELKEAS